MNHALVLAAAWVMNAGLAAEPAAPVQATLAPKNAPEKKEQVIRISKEEPLKIKGDMAQFHTSEKVTYFMGHVQMTHAGNYLVCETLKAFGETPDRAERTEMFGNVRWEDKERGAVLLCDFAIYEKGRGRLFARGHPVLTVEKEKVVTQVVGDELEIFSKEERALAHRNVVIDRLTTHAKGDEAVYDYHMEQVQLTGHPEVIQRKSVFTGEEIWMFMKEDRVEIRRAVKATVFPEDTKEEPPAKP